VRWIWDPQKAASNLSKHKVSFATAQRVFNDPLQMSKVDPHVDGDRWQTVGRVGTVLLLVVHTWSEGDRDEEEPLGRIISARKATAHERRAYEEGYS
jgi:uncharacterized protein